MPFMILSLSTHALRTGPFNPPHFEIYRMSATGTLQTRLTRNPAIDHFPAWSPDGTRIAFVSNRTTGTGVDNLDGDNEIFQMSARGATQSQLTFINVFDDTFPRRQPAAVLEHRRWRAEQKAGPSLSEEERSSPMREVQPFSLAQKA
jgi:dipeptidyl aminopeptidase/acylaminoacyl peptidase